MATKRVIFIRPGETQWNRLGRWQGQVAVPLNDHGKMQAKRLARFIRAIGIQALYTSDLRRASETADVLAEMLGFEVVSDARLRERHIGLWQGLTLPEVQEWYPDQYQSLRGNPDAYQIEGGEAREVVAKRMKAAFDEIVAKPHDIIGIVSHTTAIRALLDAVIPDVNALAMDFSNMSVTSIAKDDGGAWRIVQRNDVTHLEGMPTEVSVEPDDKKETPNT
jgi:broad specificity phosphatase PhoE